MGIGEVVGDVRGLSSDSVRSIQLQGVEEAMNRELSCRAGRTKLPLCARLLLPRNNGRLEKEVVGKPDGEIHCLLAGIGLPCDHQATLSLHAKLLGNAKITLFSYPLVYLARLARPLGLSPARLGAPLTSSLVSPKPRGGGFHPHLVRTAARELA